MKFLLEIAKFLRGVYIVCFQILLMDDHANGFINYMVVVVVVFRVNIGLVYILGVSRIELS
jgi:hypothetical protein